MDLAGSGRDATQRLSLRLAVALAVSLGLLVPMTVAAWLEMRAVEQEAYETLQKDAAVIADVMAMAMRHSFQQGNPASGRAIGQAMLRDPRVVGVMVSTADGKPFIDIYRSVDAMARNVSETRPVSIDGLETGSVEVTLSTAPLLRYLADHRYGIAWRFALGLVVALALVLWVLDRWLLRPLSRIATAAGRLARQQLDEPIRLARRDELGQLAQALEQTRVALREAFLQLERRNAELKGYADSLEVRVERRTVDLGESNARLTHALTGLKAAQRTLVEAGKLASLGRLVAGITHELNTPLGDSMTVVTELDDRFAEFHDAISGGGVRRSELERFLAGSRVGVDILRGNIQHAARLIAHFKQLVTDQSAERRRTFDLAHVVRETLGALDHRFNRTPFLLHAELTDNLMMESYPGPLEQVIIALVNNALTHAFKGRDYGTVTVRADRIGSQRVRLVVRDDGIGISEVQRELVFEPFANAASGGEATGGSGLGLSIVYSQVSGILGGRIDVQSRPGEGMAVIIDLPTDAPRVSTDEGQPAGVAQ